MMYVYCAGYVSYDAREGLPSGVYSTLAAAQASFDLKPDGTWVFNPEGWEWRHRGGRGDREPIIARYEIDPSPGVTPALTPPDGCSVGQWVGDSRCWQVTLTPDP